MRITNLMVSDRLVRDIQQQKSAIAGLSEQASSGQRLTAISDDPLAGVKVLRDDRTLRAIQQYHRSANSVQTQMNAEESALNEVTDLLARSKEIGVSEGGSSATAASRSAALAEVNQLYGQLVGLGNTAVGDLHIFGGTATGVDPFQPDGTYVGNTTVRQAEVGAGVVIDTIPTGQSVFVDSGVLSSVAALRDALAANDPTAIQASIGTLDNAFDQTQSALADVGARGNGLTALGTHLDSLATAATDDRSTNADASLDQVITQLAQTQLALQAAYQASSKMLQTSLTNYLG